jgi:adenylate cyclase
MEMHNNILRENLKLTGGYEVKTEGDSFMVAFHSPVSAVWWCLFAQEALLNANWPSKYWFNVT